MSAEELRLSSAPLEDFLSRIILELKWTIGSRFRAEERLLRSDKLSTYIISLSSAFVVTLTIFPLVLKIDASMAVLLNAASIVASILLLVVSLLQVKNEFGARALIMRWSGLELNALRKRAQYLVASKSITPESIEKILEDRTIIFSKYDDNHEQKDFLVYKFAAPWEFDDLTKGIKYEKDKIKYLGRRLRIISYFFVAIFSRNILLFLFILLCCAYVFLVIFLGQAHLAADRAGV